MCSGGLCIHGRMVACVHARQMIERVVLDFTRDEAYAMHRRFDIRVGIVLSYLQPYPGTVSAVLCTLVCPVDRYAMTSTLKVSNWRTCLRKVASENYAFFCAFLVVHLSLVYALATSLEKRALCVRPRG